MRVFLLLTFLLMLSFNASAQSNITDCDRLAAHPSDPDKLTEGIPSESVKIPEAVAACQSALKAAPDDARLNYQLGRVLFYKKEYAEGFRYLEKSAKLKYRQAQFVVGYLHTEGREGFLKPDHCKAIPLWQEAANRGHYAAEISLSRNYLRGVYASCEMKFDRAVLIGYLESAKKKTKSYYEQILVDYLLEEMQKKSHQER